MKVDLASDTPLLPPPDSIAATLILEKALKEHGLPMLGLPEARIGYEAAYRWLGEPMNLKGGA